MSWFASLPTGAATRTGDLEAREKRRAEIEAERLLRKQKSEQRKKLTQLGVSAPPSPSLSRATTPPPSESRIVESEPVTPAALTEALQTMNTNTNTVVIRGDNGNEQQQPVNNGGGGGAEAPPGGPPAGPPGGPGPGGPPGGGGGPPGGPGGPNDQLGGNNQRQPPQAAAAGDYDILDTADGPRALDRSANLTVQIELEDIAFWFSELESEMLLSSIGSQWLKLSVLRKNLPNKQREDIKSLLRLPKSLAGPTPYYDAKMQLLKIYSVRPKDVFKKAMGRVLVGLPSQLGKQLIDDICQKPAKLQGCCCAQAVQALWSLQLPVNINQHVSNMDFNANTFQAVFDAADRAYLSSKSLPAVAAVATPPGYSMTAGANDPLNTAFNQADPTVAAVTRGRGRGGRNRGNRGGRGGNQNRGNQNNNSSNNSNQSQGGNQGGQGGQNQKPRKGPRHSSMPPHSTCDNHFVHGDQAWFCSAPLRCPWKDRVVERP